MYEAVLFEKADSVATIALNRPERLNAFDGGLHRDLHAALDEAASDDDVRCVVLRGEGRGFSAGADLRGEDLVRENGVPPDLGEYLRRTFAPSVERISAMDKPIIASLHGPVYGAGLGLALACDLRIAAESAKFSVAFVKIGLMPDAGVTYYLPRVIGLGRAMEMSLLGDAVNAEEALSIGLVNRVVPDEKLGEETTARADRLANMPTRALAGTRRAMCASFEGDLRSALEREAEGQSTLGYTADHEEGVAAFFEKREPRFTGH
ncbi:MAG: enoyl-CoA hydratase-related protein [Actinomycetota bacterium]|nr:enoyl-CoA hydratase-related protein [Actinomycetota bacterium]